MDFELTRENLMIKNAIRDWVTKECKRELVSELDEMGSFPEKLLKKLNKLGFSGMIVPEEFEGEGKNVLGACLVAEEIATVYPALAGCYISSAFLGGPVISQLGTRNQKNKYLPEIAGNAMIVSQAFAEEKDADADIITATAVREGDGYRLNGDKSYVALANRAGLVLISARVEEDSTEKGLTLFCLEPETAGMTISPMKFMGLKGIDFCKIELQNVAAGPDTILGGKEQTGQGSVQLKLINDYALLGHAASAVGLSQGAFDYALQYARQRQQFGQPIGRFPALGHVLSDLSCRLDAARLLVYRSAWLLDQDRKCSKEIAGARCISAEVAVKSAMEGLQVLGGYGYTLEYDSQRFVRDSIALLSLGKSQDYLYEQIGSSLGLA